MIRMARNTLTVIGREALALIFIVAGLSHIADYAEIATYVEGYGMSRLFLSAVIVLEIGAGLALALGFYTRVAAAALIAYALLDAMLFMFPAAESASLLPLLLQMALVAGLVRFALHGADRFSVDAFLSRGTSGRLELVEATSTYSTRDGHRRACGWSVRVPRHCVNSGAMIFPQEPSEHTGFNMRV
jgi:putative oxidoreductase